MSAWKSCSQAGSRCPPFSRTRTTRRRRSGSARPGASRRSTGYPSTTRRAWHDPHGSTASRAYAPGLPLLLLLPAHAPQRNPRHPEDRRHQPPRLPAPEIPRPVPGQLGAHRRGRAGQGSPSTSWRQKPDAGDIVAQKAVEIAFEDTAHTLALKLAAAAARLMRDVMPLLESGTFARRPQEGPSSYYGGRRPEDGIIDWTKSAVAIYNLVRAVTHPYPGAFTSLDGRKLFIWKALPQEGTADGHRRHGGLDRPAARKARPGTASPRFASAGRGGGNGCGAAFASPTASTGSH